MKIPKFITFTGIDDRTDLVRANALARKYPIEWGVLFSKTNQHCKFPSEQGVDDILNGTVGAKSAHICGAWSKDLWKNSDLKEVPLLMFDRVQVNGSRFIGKRLAVALKIKYNVQAIGQTWWSDLTVAADYEDVDYLFDCSGGKGITPETIHPMTVPFQGYSGGMGPNTVIDYLSKIKGDGEFWIDMENNVRTNGWFDLDKVQQVCELVYPD